MGMSFEEYKEYIEWWDANINFFARSEFGVDWYEMDKTFMVRLDRARSIAAMPFVVTSDFRLGDIRSHGRGRAVDLSIQTSTQRFRMYDGLRHAGFVRIGVYDKHMHVDDMTVGEGFPQEVMWIGKSR